MREEEEEIEMVWRHRMKEDEGEEDGGATSNSDISVVMKGLTSHICYHGSTHNAVTSAGSPSLTWAEI